MTSRVDPALVELVESPVADSVVASARPFRLGLTTRFRGTTAREGLLLLGPAGYGEFAPFPEYGDIESARWLLAGLEASCLPRAVPPDCSVAVNAIIPAVDPERAYEMATRAVVEDGCVVIKIKVAETGQNLADDLARIQAVVDAGRDSCQHVTVRLDANGAWSVDQAGAALDALAERSVPVDYVEQPCATTAELAKVRRSGSIRIAADEVVRRGSNPTAVVEEAAADVVILKVAPIGGLGQILGIKSAIEAKASEPVEFVVSSALDTGVGLAAGIAAAHLVNPHGTHGLATARLLARDVCAPGPFPKNGRVVLGDCRVDEHLIIQAGADVERNCRTGWQDRAVRCLKILRTTLPTASNPLTW